jgi:hypothetical protein
MAMRDAVGGVSGHGALQYLGWPEFTPPAWLDPATAAAA